MAAVSANNLICDFEVLLYSSLGAATLSDAIVTGSLCNLLSFRRTGFKRYLIFNLSSLFVMSNIVTWCKYSGSYQDNHCVFYQCRHSDMVCSKDII